MSTIESLFTRLWDDYSGLVGQPGRIKSLFEQRGDRPMLDHLALRGFGLTGLGIEALAHPFLEAGYRKAATYSFEQKQLDAAHFEPPHAGLPLVFISQLRVERFSPWLQERVRALAAAVPTEVLAGSHLCCAGVPWPRISHADYLRLLQESEYAAWLAAFGFRANHFAFLVNSLPSFSGLPELNDFLKAQGFALNSAGGEIKGSPALYLEQSSTLAQQSEVEFTEGRAIIPSCYTEFALRHPLPDGRLFTGFIEASANHIFESTAIGQKW
ncbi:MAG: hypothetical protein RL095_2505 [Verrucomicrobiota bacterium]